MALTQAQFATLLGVHALTVSKWERGVLRPSAYNAELMESFERARRKAPDVGTAAAGVLVVAGVTSALYLILKHAFEDK